MECKQLFSFVSRKSQLNQQDKIFAINPCKLNFYEINILFSCYEDETLMQRV